MQRFCQHQAIYSTFIPYTELSTLFPSSYQQEDNSKISCDSLFLLNFANNPLSTIPSFAWTDDMRAIMPLPPYYEEVFTVDEANQLNDIYKQLYPSRDLSQKCMPVTHHKFGRLMLAGDLVGSEMPGPNSRSSAVIKAYWPSRGHDLDSIEYSAMQVGVVQYFLQHKLCYFANNSKKKNCTFCMCEMEESTHTP